jgi:hypothetical protein
MRFVAIKCVEQQDIQSLHRIRSLVVAHRTAQVNPYLPVRQQQHACDDQQTHSDDGAN